jgi:hypothetical protein
MRRRRPSPRRNYGSAITAFSADRLKIFPTKVDRLWSGCGQRRPRSSVRMQYNSQCATRRRCPSCMRPALLRACTLSFCNRAASRFAPCLAAARERYLEWRRPQTFICHQPARSTTSILIFFIAGLLSY